MNTAAATFPIPTGREELWRFTPIRRLRDLPRPPAATGVVAYRAANGAGATFEVVGRDDPRLDALGAATDRVSEVARGRFAHAAVITVPDGAVLDEPVVVDVLPDGVGAAFGAVLVSLGTGSKATVILRHHGAVPYAGDVTATVGEAASLTLACVQRAEPAGVFVGHVRAVLERDARLRGVVVTLGGDLVRHTTSVNFTGPGGDAELLGAFLTSTGQHHEHRLFIDHSQPNCRSEVAYKGALAGAKAHSVWVGDVAIRPSGVGTSTFELNRNLILTPGARADSVPNLEIETGQVAGAGHASATGRFDDEQLFYLQARGIPADVARRLVVRGFFADISRRMAVPSVEAELLAAVDATLAALAALSALSAEGGADE